LTPTAAAGTRGLRLLVWALNNVNPAAPEASDGILALDEALGQHGVKDLVKV
jgi:hypothetical protein